MRRAPGRTVGLTFGASCPTLAEQLEREGVSFDPKRVATLDRASEGVTFLAIHGVLAPAEVTRARRRIIKQIGGAL